MIRMGAHPARRDRASAIILRSSRVLLIYRENSKGVYYVLPGGGIEAGETPEQAVVREVQEETGVVPVLGPLLFEGLDDTGSRHQYYFACTLLNDQEPIWQETFKQTENNIYRFEWVSVKGLENVPLKPEFAKRLIG